MSNLDNFFNKKLQNREFDFKESYWEEAEQMIEADKRKRRYGRYFWLLGFLAFFIVGGSIVLFGWINPKADNVAEVVSELSVQKENLTNQNNLVGSKSTTTNDERNSTDLKLLDANIISQQKNNLTSESIENDNNESILEANNKNDEKASNASKIVKNKENRLIQNQVGPDLIPSMKVDQKKSQQNVKQSTEINDLQSNELILKETEKLESVSELSPIAGLVEQLAMGDYLILEDHYKPQISKSGKFKFGLSIASMFYPKTGNDVKTWIGGSGGATGQFKLSKKLSFNGELLYTFRKGTFDANLTGLGSVTTQTIYGFGKRTVNHYTKPKSLHFIDLPLYAKYHIGKHGIEGGLAFSYLLGVQGDIEKETSLQPWERTDENEFLVENFSSGWIEKKDFSTFQTSLLLGYKYSLDQQWAVGLRGIYRFGKLSSGVVLKESDPITFNISATWYFIK